MTVPALEAVDRVIAGIDAALSRAVDAILHLPAVQALEAAWRGLAFVVDRVAFDENIQVVLWDCSKDELRRDFEDASEVTRSHVYRTLYTAEYGQFGGRPYGAVFIDAAFAATHEDIALLRALASVAAMAHAPVFVAADPGLLRLRTFSDLPQMTDPGGTFDDPLAARWNAFRDSDDSRYVGVLLPRLIMRRPFRDDETPASLFVYEERVAGHGDLLFGNPTYAFAVRIADSFARYRTYTGLLEVFEDDPPVSDPYRALLLRYDKPAVEVVLSRRLEQELSELGLIPLTWDGARGTLRFTTANSVQRPRTFGSQEGGRLAEISFLLGTRLPYLLLACRFAHYLKVLERERLGVHQTSGEIEQDLNEWLARYVVVMDGASPATRLRYPLRNARVRVQDIDGVKDYYRMEVHIQPHLKYLQQSFTLSVLGRLEAR